MRNNHADDTWEGEGRACRACSRDQLGTISISTKPKDELRILSLQNEMDYGLNRQDDFRITRSTG